MLDHCVITSKLVIITTAITTITITIKIKPAWIENISFESIYKFLEKEFCVVIIISLEQFIVYQNTNGLFV